VAPQKSEASAKAGPGVLLAGNEPGSHSSSYALRHHFLTGKQGVADNLARIVGDIFFGEVRGDDS
jgi:hypothetical protein